MSSRRRKTNSRDPRRPRPTRRDIHATPPGYDTPILIERDLAELAAEIGLSVEAVLDGLDEIEASRHLVRMRTDDPSVVKFWPVFPDQYDRIRKAADFFVTDKGRELEQWIESWIDDPTIPDSVRESLQTVAAAVIDGNGTYDGGDFVITVGDVVDDDLEAVYAIGYPQGYQPRPAVRDE